VLADTGDAIEIQGTTVKNIWIDQCDLSSDLDHDPDYYECLLDITHGVQYVSITNTRFHDHWKASLVGDSDSNGSEDVVFTVTYAYNYWYNINSGMPSFRFGKGHIFNSYFKDSVDGIYTRVGAVLRVENNVFYNVVTPIYEDGGCATAVNNQDAIPNLAPPCNPALAIPYAHTLLALSSVSAYVTANSGTH
ncbi:hypothetical protein FRC02_004588, partial [Tulasnella sp. 418]